MIGIYASDIKLGVLTENGDSYLWVPIISNIKEACRVVRYGMELFMLPLERRVYKKIPEHFNEYLFASERFDLREKAGIVEGDSDMVKLEKMSRLNYGSELFTIKAE